MMRKDYIVRQMEEMGKVMAVILGFKRQEDWDKFQEEIDKATKKFTALEVNGLENATDEAFDSMAMSDALELDQKKILADLLFEKLDLYIAKNEQAAYTKLKNRLLRLYTHIRNNFTENEFDLNVHYRLEFLNKIDE